MGLFLCIQKALLISAKELPTTEIIEPEKKAGKFNKVILETLGIKNDSQIYT